MPEQRAQRTRILHAGVIVLGVRSFCERSEPTDQGYKSTSNSTISEILIRAQRAYRSRLLYARVIVLGFRSLCQRREPTDQGCEKAR